MRPRASLSATPLHLLGPGLLLSLGLLAGCKREPVVATLVDHAGPVRKATGDAGWEPVAGQDDFHCQDFLQTGADAWARVDIHGSGRVRLDPGAVIRFACTPGEPVFDLQIGEATLSTAEGEGAWMLEIGHARLSPGTELRVRAGDDAMRFEVVVGSAVIERGAGAESLAPGDILEVLPGTAEVRRVARATAPAPVQDTRPIDAGVPDAGVLDAAPPPPESIEVMVTVEGRGSTVRLPGEKRWSPLPSGAHQLPPGAELRLGRRGSVELAGGAGQVGIEAPGELTIGSPDGSLARVRKGDGWIRARTGDVALEVPGGELRARAGASGSRAAIAVGRDRTRVRALLGAVALTTRTGTRGEVTAGERSELTHDGRILILDEAPARADLVVPAGESPVIHDPRPPTAVGIRFGGTCAGEGIIEVSASAGFRGELVVSKGSGQANVRIDQRPAVHHYRVRCIEQGGLADRAAAHGAIRVVRDAGTRELPRAAPVNTVDADGRRYTVLYQNRLPQITFQWPGTSDKGPYRLHLVPEKGQEQVFASKSPTHRLPAGELDEGTFQYFFEGASTRSKTSVLRIDFDNAAPSASVRLPGVNQSWSGGTLEVAGMALPDSEVSVDGVAVPLDRQSRFSTRVALPIASGSVAVRLTHPRQGVHYYLRRDASRR
jgi:ferric-dicitrate binding protein FerR (iron transport regulator)